MRVVHFQRKPGVRHFSIERLFEDIRHSIAKDIEVDTCINKYLSTGFFNRVYDTCRAMRRQGDINHITGDVHFLSFLMQRSRTVLTIHDCVTLERLSGLRYWVYFFFWYWLPVRRSAVVTVISQSTKKELDKHLNTSRLSIEIIPNCVSTEFQPSAKPFNTHCPNILQIGTSENKNLLRITKALAGIPCTLVIVGELSENQRNSLQNNKINFINHIGIDREQLVKLYQQSDIVMFASLYEGFGLPILEANAIGRPVITSNIYSMPGVAGNAACYVNPYQVKEINTAVKRIINDSAYRTLLIENGFQNVENYRPEVIAEKYAQLYRKLYSDKKHPLNTKLQVK
ncbi:MAG: glycosyltransferase [Methyloprofundus sp.]|nr:glycosyltransferase [Methyloprofundus sp.]